MNQPISNDDCHSPVPDELPGDYLDVSMTAARAGIAYAVWLDPAVARALAARNLQAEPQVPQGATERLLHLLVPFRWIAGKCRSQTEIRFAIGRGEARLPLVARFCCSPVLGYYWKIALAS